VASVNRRMSTVPSDPGTATIGTSDAIVASPSEVPWGQATFSTESSARSPTAFRRLPERVTLGHHR
jgi:hypothetical protein